MHTENKKQHENIDSVNPSACKYAVKEYENIFSYKKKKGISIVHNIRAPLWAVGIVHGTPMLSGYRNLP
jgi:hypothetical protein